VRFDRDQSEDIIKSLWEEGNDTLPFDVRIIYTSIYEERWELYLNSGSSHPKRL